MKVEAPQPGTRPAPGTFSALLQEIARAPTLEVDAAPVAPGAGQMVGRFEVVKEIGRGGFGVVLEARDPVLGRRVALKLVRPGRPADRLGARGFEEAEALARLSHPNIVQIHDAGTSEAGPYLVFELLQGEALSARLERGPMPVAEAARTALQVARGLAHAHGSSVVHRDLKPSNVFVTGDGQVKVLDFGLALVFGARRTIEGGTPGWMAPEQRVGAPEDERTDVWALGAILFRAIAGKDPGKARLEIPEAPELERLLERLLDPDPVRRPRDAREVVAALEPIVRGLEAATRPVAVRVRRRVPRPLRYAVPVALVAGALVTGALLRDRASSLAGDDGRILTAVADVQNHTGEVELDALSGLLTTALGQSKVLKVLSRGRMFQALRQMGQDSVDRFDEPVAREIAQRLDARVMLAWSVRKFGDTYSIELKGLDPRKDEYLFALEERVEGKARILAAIDRLSARTREKLHGTAMGAPAGPTLATNAAATTNLEAYRHYFRAVDLAGQLKTQEAFDEARRALELDPDFAEPALFMAQTVLPDDTHLDERKAAMRTAVRNADRVPESLRLRILAHAAHFLDGRDDRAIELYRQATERYPDDVDAWFWGGELSFRRLRLAEALPWFEQAARLGWPSPHHPFYLIDAYCAVDRCMDGAAAARRAFELDPKPANRFGLGWIHYLEGNEDAYVEERRRWEIEHRKKPWPSHVTGAMLHAVGRLEEAEAVLRSLKEAPASDLASVDYTLSLLLASQGRAKEALALIPPGLKRSAAEQDYGPPEAYRNWIARWREDRTTFLANVRAGAEPGSLEAFLGPLAPLLHGARLLGWIELEAARQILAEALSKWPQEGCDGLERRASRYFAEADGCSSHLELYAALLQFWDGERAEGLARLGKVAARLPGLHLTHAHALHEAGRDVEALEAARRAERWFRSQEGGPARLPETWFVQARALERLGRTDEARARVEKLLAWWKKGDADVPMVAEAKALGKRVGAKVP